MIILNKEESLKCELEFMYRVIKERQDKSKRDQGPRIVITPDFDIMLTEADPRQGRTGFDYPPNP